MKYNSVMPTKVILMVHGNYLVILLLSLSSNWLIHAVAPPAVQVTGGLVAGSLVEGTEIQVFKGIPFAAPPTGHNRWGLPTSHSLDGVRNCTAFGPQSHAVQNRYHLCTGRKNFDSRTTYQWRLPLFECLDRSQRQSGKVRYWSIFMEGFRSGSGCAIYDGTAMAEKESSLSALTTASIISAFAHPELTGESGYGASGNYALLDMIKLPWSG